MIAGGAFRRACGIAILMSAALSWPVGAEQTAAPSAAIATDEEPRTIEWDDLMPALDPVWWPFDHLTQDQVLDLEFISLAEIQSRLGEISPVGFNFEYAEEARHALTTAGHDVDALLEELRRFNAALEERGLEMNEAVAGGQIRMAGYALPLEFTGEPVKHFLLVPYIGACIHTPAPPANQMVLVEAREPVPADTLYTPVWVQGQIDIDLRENTLSFVDGTDTVTSGYLMADVMVEPYGGD